MSKVKITFKSEIIIDTEICGMALTFDEFTQYYKNANIGHPTDMYQDINNNIKCIKMEHIDD